MQRAACSLMPGRLPLPGEIRAPAIKPGDTAASELVRRVASTDDDAMPPDGNVDHRESRHNTLEQEGAEMAEPDADRAQWSTSPSRTLGMAAARSTLPPRSEERRSSHRCVRRLQAARRGFPAREADRRTLIRRLSLIYWECHHQPRKLLRSKQTTNLWRMNGWWNDCSRRRGTANGRPAIGSTSLTTPIHGFRGGTRFARTRGGATM